MFPIPTFSKHHNHKHNYDKHGKVKKKNWFVWLEAEARLLKMDKVNQGCLNNVRSETKWKQCSIVKYEATGSYYIRVS